MKEEGVLLKLNTEPKATLQTFEIVENGLVEHLTDSGAGGPTREAADQAADNGTGKAAYSGPGGASDEGRSKAHACTRQGC